MHPGWAAHSGNIAASLAEAGFRCRATVLEGLAGVYASHIGERPSAEVLGFDTLDTRRMTAEVALKPYPCCHFTHAGADAAFRLLDVIDIDHLRADQVDAIDGPNVPALLPMVAEPAERKTAPTSIYDALFSQQYVVACALVGRGVRLATFYDEPCDRPHVLAKFIADAMRGVSTDQAIRTTDLVAKIEKLPTIADLIDDCIAPTECAIRSSTVGCATPN